MNWCILIPLIVGLICAILGYLLGRLLRENKNDDDKIAKLEAELNACKTSKLNLEKDLTASKNVLTALEADLETAKTSQVNLAASMAPSAIALIPFNADAAKAVFGKKIKENDLTIVEGIGPKIQGLFHEHDVKTWKALSECSIEKCQEVLNSGGSRYKMHKPTTWPKQAKLAYEGNWEALKKWQDELDGGK